MKFKKLLISASAIAAGSGLLATVLTSCAKANIDEKLRVELDKDGALYKAGKMESKTFTWKEAITNALTRSNNWSQFKSALADEIVYSWYNDRAAPDKSSDKKNSTFRTNIDEWNYQINKDYDNIVQTCKNKYGANWAFYLQNEYLSVNGGSEASYKRNKLIDKVKADFVTKVFAKNYFGFRTENLYDKVLPYTFTKATKNVTEKEMRDPANWDKFGFFATADLSFHCPERPTPEQGYAGITEEIQNQLAKNPEGDYAAIQDYVFDRFFKTEKPFFSSAALFKYSMPKHTVSKLDQVYNATRTGVKLPDKPNEAFPFFGSGDEGSTRKANDFFTHLNNGKYATPYGTKKSNGTVTIDLTDTDDTQTVLLMYGNTMFGNIYTPYAMAAGNLYDRMIVGTADPTTINTVAKTEVERKIGLWEKGVIDDFAMLSNFFFTKDNLPSSTYKNVLDLNKLYGGLTGEGTADEEYHCPLFCDSTAYPYFYYGYDATTGKGIKDGKQGIRYITSSVEITGMQFSTETNAQPWVMELNESGVHFQTIDGYDYIRNGSDTETLTTEAARLGRLKKVVMYRLMQKQASDSAAACISTDLLGDTGKLKTYFNDNFANIILELAMTDDVTHQIFRPIAKYNEATVDQETTLLHAMFSDEHLGDTYNEFTDFINKIIDYDKTKKIFSNLDSVNNKIYSYRSKQITNSKAGESFAKTVFENGLLAPFTYAYSQTGIDSKHDFNSVNRIVVQDLADTSAAREKILTTGYVATMQDLQGKVEGATYITKILANAKVNDNDKSSWFGFSPQINTAKAAMSNRFWYGSRLVDRVLHSFMGSKAFTANQIKMNAYDFYVDTKDTNKEWFGADGKSGKFFGNDASKNSFLTTYARSKVLAGEKNLATYVAKADIDDGYTLGDYYTTLGNEFKNYQNRETIENGPSSDENLNLHLFKATLMYLIGSDKTEAEGGKAFDHFYTLLNAKVSEDEAAVIAYMTRGYSDSVYGKTLDTTTTKTIVAPAAGAELDYDFDANVDNMFDKFGYEGGTVDSTIANSKITSSSYWTALSKTFRNGVTRDFNGFLGLQTKANNQLDSGSNLQKAVFDEFAEAMTDTWDLSKDNSAVSDPQYTQDYGCWFKFGGQYNNNGKPITWSKFEMKDGKGTMEDTQYCEADKWWPMDSEYAPVRKVAYKILSYSTPDDLRSLAKTLASSFKGSTEFAEIGSGRRVFTGGVPEMQSVMLRLLPSQMAHDHPTGEGFEGGHEINTFKRITNAEPHTTHTVSPSTVFIDSKSKTAYKLMLTQINKADIVEKRLTPKYEGGTWVQGDSPITPEEFWAIFFNLASETTVQQRVITEAVANAFGDDKLIVYDAQLYNQFDSVWIKDWTKKTIGA